MIWSLNLKISKCWIHGCWLLLKNSNFTHEVSPKLARRTSKKNGSCSNIRWQAASLFGDRFSRKRCSLPFHSSHIHDPLHRWEHSAWYNSFPPLKTLQKNKMTDVHWRKVRGLPAQILLGSYFRDLERWFLHLHLPWGLEQWQKPHHPACKINMKRGKMLLICK